MWAAIIDGPPPRGARDITPLKFPPCGVDPGPPAFAASAGRLALPPQRPGGRGALDELNRGEG